VAGKNGVLATLDPAVGQRQSAYALGLLMICGFVLTLPLFRAHFAQFSAFSLVVDTATALLAALVAVLLLAQFMLLRGMSLLLLGCGFLFIALTTVPQLVRVARGLPPDPRLAFIVQLALPVAAIGYAALARPDAAQVARGGRAAAELAGALVITAGFAALFSWLTPASAGTPGWSVSSRAITALCLLAANGVAMALLWRRRGATLELWLLVALTAWLIATLLQAMAHDSAAFAWHVARVYGMLGVTCMLAALLAENVAWARRARTVSRAAGAVHDPRMSEISAVDTVAEQLSQPLCAITANVDAIERLLARQAPDIAEVRAALGDISRDTQRANETIRMVQRLSAGAHEPPAEIDVGQLLDECLGQMRAEMQLHRVTCEVETAEQLPGIRGIRKQLRHLLVNLFSNALEAMSEPQQRERRLRVRASRHDARAIVILVEDSGCGIRAQDARRVFDPFFTTKPYRTGLGLAVCRSIAYAHGGHISVAEGRAGGTAFQVVLPVSS